MFTTLSRRDLEIRMTETDERFILIYSLFLKEHNQNNYGPVGGILKLYRAVDHCITISFK